MSAINAASNDQRWFELRQAEEADFEPIAELCRAGGLLPWAPASLESGETKTVQVAVHNSQIVGLAKTHWHAQADGIAPAGHYLGGIIVHPGWRRQGIGAELTAARLRWIGQRAKYAYYFTNEQNQASRALHATLGFERLAEAEEIHSVRADDGASKLLLFEAELG